MGLPVTVTLCVVLSVKVTDSLTKSSRNVSPTGLFVTVTLWVVVVVVVPSGGAVVVVVKVTDSLIRSSRNVSPVDLLSLVPMTETVWPAGSVVVAA